MLHWFQLGEKEIRSLAGNPLAHEVDRILFSTGRTIAFYTSSSYHV